MPTPDVDDILNTCGIKSVNDLKPFCTQGSRTLCALGQCVKYVRRIDRGPV